MLSQLEVGHVKRLFQGDPKARNFGLHSLDFPSVLFREERRDMALLISLHHKPQMPQGENIYSSKQIPNVLLPATEL